MKTELTKEQSQHLIDLGVPKEKASGFEYIGELKYDPCDNYFDTPLNEKAPIFRLEDFLNGEILPLEIYSDVYKEGECNEVLPESYGDYDLVFRREFGKWKATYINSEDWEIDNFYGEDELIDAFYKLACSIYYRKILKENE